MNSHNLSPLLETENLTKTFGDLIAVNGVNMKIEEGNIHALIGPNGAGKTTLFNMLAGEYSPTSGKIKFNGKDITGLPAHKISHLGIGRSFQITNIFFELTVMENLQLAAQSRGTENYKFMKDVSNLGEVDKEARKIMDRVGLSGKANKKAGELPRADQRALEVGIALGTDPILLLLDEPTSGMPPEEISRMTDLIKNISQELTILLVEHKMRVVMSISDKISVLHQGEIICEGSPEEVHEDEAVKKAYLGRVE